MIRTVLGDIASDDLGACYPHEHVLGRPPGGTAELDFTMDSEAAAIQELTWFRQAGGRALVEMSPRDYGRDVRGLRRVSQATGVHIVCTTGLHKETFSAAWAQDRSVETLADDFRREITTGIDGTDVRAGVIKAASSLNCITSIEEKIFRAAARAQRVIGAPISTHTEAGTYGLEQISLLRSEGADPTRIIIGHVDRKLDWDYHLALAKTGAYLGYDQIGKEKYAPDARRVEFILRLVSEGYGKQILLASDLARRSSWPSYGTGGGPGLTFILWRFVPWLRSGGLPESAVQDVLVHNPARVLSLL